MSTWRASALGLALAGAGAALALGAGAGAQPDRGVIASELGEVDPLLIGVRDADPAHRRLPRTLWAGSDLASIEEAAARVPGEGPSLAAAELAARVLETGGQSPGGAGDLRAAARERTVALLELGRIDAVDAIVTGTPRGLDEPRLASVAVRARLARNDLAPACRVADALTEGREAPFWVRMRVACLVWAEESAAAQMTLDLMRESSADLADDVFATWVSGAENERAPSGASAPRDVIEAALARTAGYKFPAGAGDQETFLVALSVAIDSEADPVGRLERAWRAARAGAVSAEEIGDIIAIAAPAAGRSANELFEAGQANPGVEGDILLIQAASSGAANPFIAAQAAEAALARAGSPADFVLMARLLADDLASLPTSPELVEHAPALALAAAAAGDAARAYAWLDPRSDRLAAPSQFAGAARGAASAFGAGEPPDLTDSPVEPLARTAAQVVAIASTPSPSPRELAEVAEARLTATARGGEEAQAGARRDALILLALGAETSPALRRAAGAALIEASPAPTEAEHAVRMARLAAQAGALGEAALRASEAASMAGPGHAPTYAAVIEILRALGLEADARALAVESLLASRVGEPGAAWR